MKMNELMVNEMFYVEKIKAPQAEIDVLKTIGITEGKCLMILGKGFLEGSIVVNVDDKLLQLNPHFINEIDGYLINKKTKSR